MSENRPSCVPPSPPVSRAVPQPQPPSLSRCPLTGRSSLARNKFGYYPAPFPGHCLFFSCFEASIAGLVKGSHARSPLHLPSEPAVSCKRDCCFMILSTVVIQTQHQHSTARTVGRRFAHADGLAHSLDTGDTSSRGRSAGLVPIHHLASNNPFRPRGLSPSNNDGGDISPPLASPFDDPTPPPRPTSRNPFLDPTHQALAAAASRSLTDKKFNMAAVAPAAKPEDKTAEELFVRSQFVIRNWQRAHVSNEARVSLCLNLARANRSRFLFSRTR